MINEDNGFEFISNEPIEYIPKSTENKLPSIEDYHEFIEGLPEWDLEPPFELVRRNQL